MGRVRVVLVVAALAVTSIGAQPGGRPLSATLTGDAVVPGPGDPDGAGTVQTRLDPGTGEICHELQVADVAPATAAHVHRGTATEAGPVVLWLETPADGDAAVCAEADRELIRQILRSPSHFYVDVHNDEYPAGAIRGQLGPWPGR